MVVLECSSKGDKRFSALYATVDFYFKTDTIENLYQLSKRFRFKGTNKILVPLDFRHSKKIQKNKNYVIDHFIIPGDNILYKTTSLTNYYKSLWYKYFIDNPKLFEYIKYFDTFTDYYRNENTINCQADVIKEISLIPNYNELIAIFNNITLDIKEGMQ